MSNPFSAQVGAVLSADIAVPAHEREVKFYSRVLRTGNHPLWKEDLLNNLGIPIIGLGAASEEYAHLPVQWMPHIQVADVATSVQRTVDLGGSILTHAKNDDGSSQWAVLRDPNGAAFGIIPVVPKEHIPPIEGASSEGTGDVGRIAWLDLTVPDGSKTRDFYQQVIGWSFSEVAMKDGGVTYSDYNMLAEDGRPAAGICHARGKNENLPPVWLIYLSVGDLTESLRRVEEEGGKVLKAVSGDDRRYEYAAIQDPVGVYLALVQA